MSSPSASRLLPSCCQRFNFQSAALSNATIRYCNVDSRRTSADSHGAIDLTAFNTDGFDVSGNGIHIHDCSV